MKKREQYSEVTLLIAAAGRGTRMGYPELPKGLVPFQGKALMEWSTLNMRRVIRKGVLLIRPEDEPKFRRDLQDWDWDDITFSFQETPRGTAFAIQEGVKNIHSDWILCVWGDHIGARYMDIQRLLSEIETSGADFILPVVERHDPYVYFQLNDGPNYLKFEETKNGSRRQNRGHSDCGVFLFRREIIQESLKRNLNLYDMESNYEINFLSLFQDMNQLGVTFKLIELSDVRLTIGINSQAEIMKYESILEMDNDYDQ